MIQPKTLAEEVLDGFNALIAESERCRDWNSDEIQALVRTVEKLQKVDAREAFVRLGGLAAICGDVGRLLEYYGKALRLPDENLTKPEYWGSLGNAGLYSEAHEIGSWMLDPKRGFFPKYWERAAAKGHILEVWNRLADAKKTYPELSDVDFSALERAVTLMGERGIRDSDVVSVLDVMGQIQREHRIMFSGPLVSAFRVMRPPEDPPYLYITIPLKASVDEVHAMNRKLARLVVEKLPEGAFPQGIVGSFVKDIPVELRAAA